MTLTPKSRDGFLGSQQVRLIYKSTAKRIVSNIAVAPNIIVNNPPVNANKKNFS